MAFIMTNSVHTKNAEKITEIRLADYTPPSHFFETTDITFDLIAEDNVVVSTKIKANKNPGSTASAQVLILNGAPEKASENSETPTMELLEVKINGAIHNHQTRHEEELTIQGLPEGAFTLEIKTRINPKANRSLNGLYTSGEKLTTQCEAQGFRNITFYLDRPDVMSRFTTTIIADKGRYPQMLSNGNPGKRTLQANGRETITWEDPFKKPAYLFALVAGDLALTQDTFTTRSGRKVDIHIYVDKGDEDKVAHAMASIKKAMAWDETAFGREYDLDLFQIVAVNDFNFGAMENKGLNIYNSSAILANPKTATDTRYEFIEGVIGHEYFHNWSGDRVTCRDWFQLSLKEGLTVFRDQEFSSDMNAREVKRIDDVIGMRTRQFAEDAGAMAHPIRPASVGSIENFYTSTVYEKGAEVIRMMHTLMGGQEGFRKGTDLYFDRHDGQAVTTEDFVKAMEDASGLDLKQFEKTWYNQAGTPTLDVTDAYNPETKEYRLTLKQSTPSTPGQATKEAFHIPVRLGLLDSKGHDMPLVLQSKNSEALTHGHVLNLTENETTFTFSKVSEKPVPSLLRNWSAPVKVNYDYSRDDLTFLMANDNDGFNRWEAGQKLGVDVLKELVSAHQQGQSIEVDPRLIQAFKSVLQDTKLDVALTATNLILPSLSYLSELYPDGAVDLDAIDAARKQTRKAIGQALEKELLERFNQSRSTESRPYQWTMADAGERSLKNILLAYLIAGNPEQYLDLAIGQFDQKHNMTDIRGALSHILNHAPTDVRNAKLSGLYNENQSNAQAMDQWFSDQALADRSDVLDHVKRLMTHEAYMESSPEDESVLRKTTNPNRVRSLVGGFVANKVHFHHKDGSGYSFLADQIIEIDQFNPMLAAGLSKAFSSARKFDTNRRQLIATQLERIQGSVDSKNVKEIVGKTLESLA